MLLRVATGSATAGLLGAGLLVGSPGHAAGSELVDRADRHGDVRAVGDTDGIDPAIVSSVDLRHVTVTRQRDGVRIVIRLKKVLPARGRWVQEVGVSMAPPSWAFPEWIFEGFAIAQHLGASQAFYIAPGDEEGDGGEPDPDDGEVFCRVAAGKGGKVVSMTVPDRCLPEESGRLEVVSLLLDKRSKGDDPFLAGDKLGVGGLVDLTP